jgi:hypothetical protein
VASVLPVLPAPTLLVVGADDVVTHLANERAMAALSGSHQLSIVPGASELFVEPGVLDVSARLAGSWFGRHLHVDETRKAHTP